MKRLSQILMVVAGVLLLPLFALAQTAQEQAAQQAHNFVGKLNEVVLFPTIALLSAVAFLVFVWGGVQYFMNAANEQSRQQGVKHITYGIIGLVIMLSAYTILNIAAGTFGVDKNLNCYDNPNASGCDTIINKTLQPAKKQN